jgi:hypothetical protein
MQANLPALSLETMGTSTNMKNSSTIVDNFAEAIDKAMMVQLWKKEQILLLLKSQFETYENQ